MAQFADQLQIIAGPYIRYPALGKQLGLKLEMHKRPYAQLVIDHIEENPTAN